MIHHHHGFCRITKYSLFVVASYCATCFAQSEVGESGNTIAEMANRIRTSIGQRSSNVAGDEWKDVLHDWAIVEAANQSANFAAIEIATNYRSIFGEEWFGSVICDVFGVLAMKGNADSALTRLESFPEVPDSVRLRSISRIAFGATLHSQNREIGLKIMQRWHSNSHQPLLDPELHVAIALNEKSFAENYMEAAIVKMAVRPQSSKPQELVSAIGMSLVVYRAVAGHDKTVDLLRRIKTPDVDSDIRFVEKTLKDSGFKDGIPIDRMCWEPGVWEPAVTKELKVLGAEEETKIGRILQHEALTVSDIKLLLRKIRTELGTQAYR